jgi:hypothetical protein
MTIITRRRRRKKKVVLFHTMLKAPFTPYSEKLRKAAEQRAAQIEYIVIIN